MQFRGAVSSHVGNVRETNQDRAHFGGFVAVVADGMGGHQGGEMAASIAVSGFVDVVDPIPPGGLVELVEDANRAVFERASDPDLRGMGTTLVAITLRPTESSVSVVNVGDSRAYLLRDGELNQLTLDHSLVEDLVRQDRLTPDEAANHPQRNILTRALGIASHVEVDRFLVPTNVGDRFLLCSDGLFNEVTEPEITRILTETAATNEAADTLVEAALSGAARDNITVAVIDVVVDGEGGDLSNAKRDTLMVPAVEAAGPTVGAVGGVEPDAAPSAVGVATQPVPDAPGPAPGPAVGGTEPARSMVMVEAEETAQLPAVGRSRRRPVGRWLVVAAVVLAALGVGGYVGASAWSDRSWFVAVENGELVLYQGQPDGILGVIEPSRHEPSDPELAGVTTDDLTDDGRKMLEDRPDTFGSREEAESFLAGLDVVETVDPGDLVDLESSGTAGPTSTTTAPDGSPSSSTTVGSASGADDPGQDANANANANANG